MSDFFMLRNKLIAENGKIIPALLTLPESYEILPSEPFKVVDFSFPLKKIDDDRYKTKIVSARPQEISDVESFTVELGLPKDLKIDLYIYSHTYKALCNCELSILMNHGCRCGGA